MYVVALYTKIESAEHHLCRSAIKLNSFPYLLICILLLRSWNIMRRTVPFWFFVHIRRKGVRSTEVRTREKYRQRRAALVLVGCGNWQK